MNRKIVTITAAFLMLSTMLMPLALALPWDSKNNEKFQSFSATPVPNIMSIIMAEKDYRPSEEDPNIIVASWVDEELDYTITVGEEDYYLHTDFEYEGYHKWTAVGAPFGTMYGVLPAGSKSNHWRVEYKYDFSAVADGIDGTLEMLLLYNNGESSIRSLRGTGDLQNVQIMATVVAGHHEGIVSGWPE
jgi:hypothetical protein